MTCRLNGLFSIGEDFDDEDLLGTDWAAPSTSGPSNVSAVVPSCAPCVSSVTRREQDEISLRQTGETSDALCNRTGSGNDTQTAVGKTVSPSLRTLSSSSARPPPLPPASSSPHPPVVNNTAPILASQQSHKDVEGPQKASVIQDDFDDWDIDLAELDESYPDMGTQTVKAPAPPPQAVSTAQTLSSAKKLRPSTCGQARTEPVLRELSTGRQTSGLSSGTLPLRTSFAVRSSSPAPPQSPGVFPGLASSSPVPSPFPRPARGPHRSQRPPVTPGPSPRGGGLFEPVSPAPSSVSSPGPSPRPLHTPVLTNRLVQLVSASNKHPEKRPRSGTGRPKTRRFPGPAGLLPQQPQGQSLDDIVVSVPQTPAHGAVARLPSQGPSSQSEEEEFSAGPWAVMKAEMGLDERNPSCFLHSYSVVMVLRKAALRQLVKNKVPNMAVVLKSLLHTHTDAKAMFKDPTGEIQGTVHRRLLEDRLGELKAGAVLLLKQVGVFSPSHRNHYLNVTPNNLLRIYPPDSVCVSSGLPLPALEPVSQSPSASSSPGVPGAGVSRMQLVFDEEEEEDREAGRVSADPRTRSSRVGPAEPQDPDWDADDDLDELLGEMLEESYTL
ncbi:uncharacterized protein hrob [Polymixia lowei]